MATTLPYLTLKTLWLFGSTIGLPDPGVLDEPMMKALNWATAGMELVALVLALAFTQAVIIAYESGFIAAADNDPLRA